MRIGLNSLLAAAVMSVMAVPAIAQDAQLVSYDELLERIARLEEEVANQDAPAPVAENGYADAWCNGCGVCDTCCVDEGGLYGVYENVIVTPYFSNNVAFAERIAGPAGLANNPTRNRHFNWDMNYSPRFEIGYLSGEGMGARVRYWQFEHSSDLRYAVPAGNIATVASGGAILNVANPNTLAETQSLETRVLDLEAMKRWQDCQNTVTGSFGLRYARLDQQVTAQSLTAAGALFAQLASKHDFEGIGPTISIEALRRFNCSNLGVFVNVRGSLLYGESNRHAQNAPGAGAALFVQNIGRNDQDLVTVGEMQLGLDYKRDSFFARVALEAQYWVNGGAPAVTGAAGDDTEADLGFLGVTIGTGFIY